MLTNAIQQFLDRKPFTPITLSLASRTTVRIAQANRASINSSGDVLRVISEDGIESLISIRHVVSFSPDPPADEPTIMSGERGMAGEMLRSYVRAQPFVPFCLCMADGSRIPVVGKDYILISPNGLRADVYQPDNSHSLIDVSLVLTVELLAPKVPSKNGH